MVCGGGGWGRCWGWWGGCGRRGVGRGGWWGGKCAMKVQVLADRSNVKPLPVVQNDSANPAVFLDPFGHDGDERDFLGRLDSSKNRGTPHGDVSEIIAAGDAESVSDIYHFPISK